MNIIAGIRLALSTVFAMSMLHTSALGEEHWPGSYISGKLVDPPPHRLRRGRVSAASIHADRDPVRHQQPGKGGAGELTSLDALLFVKRQPGFD